MATLYGHPIRPLWNIQTEHSALNMQVTRRFSNEEPAAPNLPEPLPRDIQIIIFLDIPHRERIVEEHGAAMRIQAAFKGYKVRIGPLRWILRYLRKGSLIRLRSAYNVAERQRGQCLTC